MDDARVGRYLRVLRHRRGLRQLVVAARAQVGQATISRLEAGHLRIHSIAAIREVFAAVDAGVRLEILWRGGELDRLLDAAHADLVASIARLLVADDPSGGCVGPFDHGSAHCMLRVDSWETARRSPAPWAR